MLSQRKRGMTGSDGTCGRLSRRTLRWMAPAASGLLALQVALLAPLHQFEALDEPAGARVESRQHACDGPIAASHGALVSSGQVTRTHWHDPGQGHRPLAPHNEALCPICASTGRGLAPQAVALDAGEMMLGVVGTSPRALPARPEPPEATPRAPPLSPI
jgi:hypothetical protein